MIETERLILRPFTAGDGAELVALDGDPDVVRYAEPDLVARPPTLADVEERILPRILADEGWWAVTDRAGGRFLGWVFLRPDEDDEDTWELGYRLRREAWGHGFATEAARAALEHGIRVHGVRRVVAWVDPRNAGSAAVVRKLGMEWVRRQDDGDDVYELRCG